MCVDFTEGTYRHRRKFGGGKTQAVARAVGVKNRASAPSVLDATAGLGRDAFVLAGLGCRVHMVERSPVLAALLADGLHRAESDSTIGPWVQEFLSFENTDSRGTIESQSPFVPDVIYLDPMYPERKRTASVKKEMQWIKALAGDDPDADTLLPIALTKATRRVVVKRPLHAPHLNQQVPDAQITTKAHRFDMYIMNK